MYGYMLVRYDDDGLGVGDPLQSIRDIVVVGHTPKHKRVPPEEEKTSTYVYRTPNSSLRRLTFRQRTVRHCQIELEHHF